MTQQSAVNMLSYENIVAKRLAFATVTVFTWEIINTGPGTKDLRTQGPEEW